MDEPSNASSSTAPKLNGITAAATNSGGGGGFVETSRADRALWLMKCPAAVSQILKSLESEAPTSSPPPSNPTTRPVAKVIISLDPLRSNDDDFSPQFTMELPGVEVGNVQKRYSMNMSKDFIPMSVFSESAQGKISVEGKVLNKFDMKLHSKDIDSYGKLCRERAKCSLKNRQIQVIGNDYGTHMRPMPLMQNTSACSDKRKIPTKSPDVKRTRRDRGEMEDIMFKLFERQPNWTLRQLIQETDQPEQFLKDILKDLCIYNNKGANQGTYELKLEYRRSGEEPAKLA